MTDSKMIALEIARRMNKEAMNLHRDADKADYTLAIFLADMIQKDVLTLSDINRENLNV